MEKLNNKARLILVYEAWRKNPVYYAKLCGAATTFMTAQLPPPSMDPVEVEVELMFLPQPLEEEDAWYLT